MPGPWNRAGFTLIELLVVIGIVAVLVALLVVAVQKVRESASRTTCTNNLKQLGLALHQYHDVQRGLPPAAINTPRLHGWCASLLPALEQNSLHAVYDWNQHWFDAGNQPVVTTRLAVMECPSAPNRARVAAGTTAGVSWSAAVGDYSTFRVVNVDLVDDGYITPPAELAGVLRLNRRTRLETVRDGTSNTVMLVEIAGRPDHWETGQLLGDLLPQGGWAQSGNSSVLSGFDPATKLRPGECAVNCTNDREIYSFHSGGANVALADGTVRFLSAGMSISTLAALTTQNGGEAVNGNEY